jgi:hypothetical protein
MELQFSYRRMGVTHTGSGRTINLGPAEVTFEADWELPDGREIELRIMWPFLLQSVCPLELLIAGRITRSSERRTVVHIEKYEFRTRGEHSFEPAIAKGTACNMVA